MVIIVSAGWWPVLTCSVRREDSRTSSFAHVETNVRGTYDELLSLIDKLMHRRFFVTDMVELLGNSNIEECIEI